MSITQEIIEKSSTVSLTSNLWHEFPITIENIKQKDLGIDCERPALANVLLSEINFYYQSGEEKECTTLYFKSGESLVVDMNYKDVKNLLNALSL